MSFKIAAWSEAADRALLAAVISRDYRWRDVAMALERGGHPKFSNSITRGFAAVGEPHVAVCLLPGTEIAFDENVECEPSFGVGILANKKIGQQLARFRQINMHNPVTHHDALEFPDGQVVLLSRLCEGQRATVLQLPAAARPEAAKERATPEVREPSLSS